jgi:hypothetical protein
MYTHPIRTSVLGTFLGLIPAFALAATGICDKTTRELGKACQLEANDAAHVALVVCLNMKDAGDSAECMEQARTDSRDALMQCGEGRAVRDEVCDAIGQGAYDPPIRPGNFVSRIDNPFAPFKHGAWWEYRGQTPDGVERDRVEVLDVHRTIQGVNVTAVRDRVWIDDELTEDTVDWFAQDVRGNVWYFGELSKAFEDGLLSSLEGSFEAGKDGAKAGILMKAAPRVGEMYRQEWSPGSAEDMAQVQSLNAPDDVPFKGSAKVLMTREFSALSPGEEELKFYVPGIGLTLELDLETGERLELVDYSH